jgi:hypothetical protein
MGWDTCRLLHAICKGEFYQFGVVAPTKREVV